MNGENTLYKKLRHDCEVLVKKGAAILREEQLHQKVVRMKDAVDLATSADIAAESFYIGEISRKYPDHAIYSEEAGEVTEMRDYVWVIDPLDGTKDFARRSIEYNTLLAVEHLGVIVACGMYRNGINALFSAHKSGGTTRNGDAISVSTVSDISKAFVGFHVPTRFNPEEFIVRGMSVLNSMVRSAYRVRPGWDDSNYASRVAEGLIDAHIVSANVNHWYDVAPGILLVQEAGGTVTDWEGNPLEMRNLSHGIVFSNGKIHHDLIRIIRKSSSSVERKNPKEAV